MYSKPFYITDIVGNNALSYDSKNTKKLYIPSLISANIDDVELGDEIVFSDYDFDGNLIEAKGLKNFYKIPYLDKYIYLFDNHNHALFFWYLEASKGNIPYVKNTLYHIDEHADMREPEVLLSREDSRDIKKVFDYTNYSVNVGNYIVPALKNGFIDTMYQIRSESSLLDYDFNNGEQNIILNLDLDFFEPNLDYIDYDLKKKVILDIAKKATVITVASSPFFIDQDLALEVFRDLFG